MGQNRPTVKMAAVRRLEDSFFATQDKELIDQLRVIKQMKESREELAKVSGIANEQVLDNLVQLGVRPETLAALALVPLVEMAWVDGEVDEAEEKAVLKAASDHITGDNHVALTLLDEWLRHRPPKDMLDAWQEYARGLCEHMPPTVVNALKRELLGHAKAVAESSGGFLGFGRKIGPEEQAMLDKLDAAFCGAS